MANIITDPDYLRDGTEIFISTTNKTIQLSAAGYLSAAGDGPSLQCVYSKTKELWKSNSEYIKYPFPLLAITEEKFEIQNGWNWADVTTKQLIRTGGWAVKDVNGNTVEEWTGVVTLGNIDGTGQIYYTQTSAASAGTNFVLTGPINQAVQIFSSGTFNYRSYLQLYVREYAKSYDTVNLDNIGVDTMTYQVYRFPIANGSDIKVTHIDAVVTSASPYSAMSIQWLASPQSVQIGTNSYNFNVIINANNGTAEQIYEFVQMKLRSSNDIDAGSATHYGNVSDEMLYFVGDTLYTQRTGNNGVYISNFQSIDTNRLVFTDNTNTQRTYPYVAILSILFGENLKNDTSAVYRIFYTNDDAGLNTGRDFGTSGAILVKDKNTNDMTGGVSGLSTITLSYDYDANVQRGNSSSGTDAPITVVGLGLSTAQYVNATGTITRSTSNSVSLVSPLERNYQNV